MVNKNIYNQLIKYVDSKEIIIPNYNKKHGNPVLFSISMKDKIMNIKGDVGAKELIEKNKDKILNLEINDQGIIKNYNFVSDFID
jgi:molybdenum cofactor cytidylyltransferase